MKTPFGHGAIIRDRFVLEDGWCSEFWNSHDTNFLQDDAIKVHRYVDSLRVTCLRGALQPGQTCVEFTLRWTRDQNHSWAHELVRRHEYNFRALHDELVALPWVAPEGRLLQCKALHPDASDPNFEVYRSNLPGIRTYSPFTEVKPLKEAPKKAPKKWTVAHVTRALLAGQFSGLTCDGVYSDDYAHDAAVNFHKGDFSHAAVHFARRIIESPSGWHAYADQRWNGNAPSEGIPNLIHICCHSFDSNHFTFQLEPRKDMARFNPIKTKGIATVSVADSRVSRESAPEESVQRDASRATATVALPSNQYVALKQSTHTKRNVPIWIARLNERVDRAEFLRVLGEAKKLDGYWSNYGPLENHGFIFFAEEQARAFAALFNDGSAGVSPAVSRVSRDTPKMEGATPSTAAATVAIPNVLPVNFTTAAATENSTAAPWRRRW